MSEEQRHETVEEFIKRGGTITRLPDSPNSFYAVELDRRIDILMSKYS